jgi:hypothetical protein
MVEVVEFGADLVGVGVVEVGEDVEAAHPAADPPIAVARMSSGPAAYVPPGGMDRLPMPGRGAGVSEAVGR